MAARSPNSTLRQFVGDGWIGPVHCAGREILRRIFVTVRDRDWQEVRATRFDSVIDESSRTARLSARHTSDLVDFEWHGDLTISEDGRSLRFAFEGQTLRDMEICRLGLIVLHPVEAMIGSRVSTSSELIEQTFTIDKQLAPQPIIGGIPGAMTEPFTRLQIEREDWGQLLLHFEADSFEFEADSFELEDQRNWGDATFKTYCTPLRKGFPRRVAKGTSVAHSVEVQFTPSPNATPIATADREMKARRLPQRLPSIGRSWRPDDHTAWDHIHVDLTERDSSKLRYALEATRALQLEIALQAASVEQVTKESAAILREHRNRIARILFYGEGVSLPHASAIERWRSVLDFYTGSFIPLFAATRGYFVEFNRSIPFLLPVDGIAFPLAATVHSDDPETLMSNVATIRDMAETARQLTLASRVALVPLALYHPPAVAPSCIDSEIAERWLAETLHHAASARVTSITLADDVADLWRP